MVPAEVTSFVGKKFVLLPTVGGSSNYKFYMMWPDSQKFAKERPETTPLVKIMSSYLVIVAFNKSMFDLMTCFCR